MNDSTYTQNEDTRYNWDLSVFYKSVDDEKFQQDWKSMEETIDGLERLAGKMETSDDEIIVETIQAMESFYDSYMGLFSYLGLSISADQTNTKFMAYYNQLGMKLSPLAVLEVSFAKKLKNLPDLEGFIEKHNLEKYAFILQEKKDAADFSMEEQLEALAAKLDNSGGQAWSRMVSYLTSTLEVDMEGKSLTLSEARNLANDPDPVIRRKAYEAELDSYKKIDAAVAFALNSIKSQVNVLAKERQYKSALDQTLRVSRMQESTLTSMLAVMEESFPQFRRYLKAKAKLVGDTNGLRWYNLFAPVGHVDKKYTIEEAEEYLVRSFSILSKDVAALIQRAFSEHWIDFLPRAGKSGGAFCSNEATIKQSRILTNFDGSYSAVNTLAHELGHAYHGFCIENHTPLNRDYSMPVAETASTFQETHMTLLALAEAETPEAKLAILEEFLTGTTQTIVDIYSRYLFEKEVFERVDEEFLDSDALQDIMLRAQDATYGDALDPEYRHPFMWACKGHYYSSGLSYYNFPYAFGAMFSMGLYSKFRKGGQEFMAKYKEMLTLTTVASCEDVAKSVGIDLSKKDFWQSSIDSFVELVDVYCELAEQVM